MELESYRKTHATRLRKLAFALLTFLVWVGFALRVPINGVGMGIDWFDRYVSPSQGIEIGEFYFEKIFGSVPSTVLKHIVVIDPSPNVQPQRSDFNLLAFDPSDIKSLARYASPWRDKQFISGSVVHKFVGSLDTPIEELVALTHYQAPRRSISGIFNRNAEYHDTIDWILRSDNFERNVTRENVGAQLALRTFPSLSQLTFPGVPQIHRGDAKNKREQSDHKRCEERHDPKGMIEESSFARENDGGRIFYFGLIFLGAMFCNTAFIFGVFLYREIRNYCASRDKNEKAP